MFGEKNRESRQKETDKKVASKDTVARKGHRKYIQLETKTQAKAKTKYNKKV